MASFPEFMDNEDAELVKKEAKLAGLRIITFGAMDEFYLCSFYDAITKKTMVSYSVVVERGEWTRLYLEPT